jgi:hypothetical protein
VGVVSSKASEGSEPGSAGEEAKKKVTCEGVYKGLVE